MSAFTFPRPGERQNAVAIPVPPGVLANVVTLAVVTLNALECGRVECSECENSRESCARAFSLLPPRHRDLVDEWLKREYHINPGEWRR